MENTQGLTVNNRRPCVFIKMRNISIPDVVFLQDKGSGI